MPKLNQIIAIEKAAKNSSNDVITQAYHKIQKPEIFSGISRTYTKKDDEGEEFPPENTLVITNAEDLLNHTTLAWTKLMDITATKDRANTAAVADVVVDGVTIIENVPVTYLIWLEKQLVDVRTFITKLPVLDPAFKWEADPNVGTGVFATPPVLTNKSKKVPKNHVKAPATDKHPAQVEVYMEDVIVGTWNTVKYSGALPQADVDALLVRVTTLQEAVKFARETANSIEVTSFNVGEPIFDFLLGD